jgi:tRNA threonylcarbamoyladenosine biosynthesis protein TsaB
MRMLALEASGTGIGLAALEGLDGSAAVPVSVLGLEESRVLSQQLMNGFAATLARAGWRMDMVDALGVGIGPGSWTSLRISLSTAKTLAQVRGWKLVGIPTFDALAAAIWRAAQTAAAEEGRDTQGQKLPGRFLLAVAGRCRPGEVYGKIFECAPDYIAVVQAEWVTSPQGLTDAVSAEALARGIDSPMVLTGDGSATVSKLLEEQSVYHLAVDVPIEALTVEIGRAAELRLVDGQEVSPLELQPLYIVPSAAERNYLEQKNAQSNGE